MDRGQIYIYVYIKVYLSNKNNISTTHGILLYLLFNKIMDTHRIFGKQWYEIIENMMKFIDRF